MLKRKKPIGEEGLRDDLQPQGAVMTVMTMTRMTLPKYIAFTTNLLKNSVNIIQITYCQYQVMCPTDKTLGQKDFSSPASTQAYGESLVVDKFNLALEVAPRTSTPEVPNKTLNSNVNLAHVRPKCKSKDSSLPRAISSPASTQAYVEQDKKTEHPSAKKCLFSDAFDGDSFNDCKFKFSNQLKFLDKYTLIVSISLA